jgi:hypothetical protein
VQPSRDDTAVAVAPRNETEPDEILELEETAE